MNKFSLGGVFTVSCYDKDGNLKWKDVTHNLVVDVGLQHILDVVFTSGVAHTNHYLGLTDGTPVFVAADTMASHGGWGEVIAYTEGTRQEYLEVRSLNVVSNSAAKASFSIDNTATVGGAFITSASDKSGATGDLIAGAPFSNGDKAVLNGDTIEIQYDFTAASS